MARKEKPKLHYGLQVLHKIIANASVKFVTHICKVKRAIKFGTEKCVAPIKQGPFEGILPPSTRPGVLLLTWSSPEQ